MSLRQEILNETRDLADNAVKSIITAIERERARKRAAVCIDVMFHAQMSQRLPKWRRIARAWHRSMARRKEARCYAQRELGNPVACAVCEKLEGGLT